MVMWPVPGSRDSRFMENTTSKPALLTILTDPALIRIALLAVGLGTLLLITAAAL